jgi:hypothetical protein
MRHDGPASSALALLATADAFHSLGATGEATSTFGLRRAAGLLSRCVHWTYIPGGQR